MSHTIFEYRDGYRAQVTVGNKRPTKDFRTRLEALDWVRYRELEARDAKEPELGGPTVAILAQVLDLYAGTYSVRKGGAKQELSRISRYLGLAGFPLVRLAKDVEGEPSTMEHYQEKTDGVPPGQKAFQSLLERRRGSHARTNDAMAKLANMKVCKITRFMIDDLMAIMTLDKIAASTIQKEIALLKAVFNTAIDSWEWKGFKNPCAEIKLGKSTPQFVHLSQEKFERLVKALAECDNPYIWPLADVAIYLTARKKSLLDLRWEDIDFENRVAELRHSKGGTVTVPLSRRVVAVLQGLPGDHRSGRVFPMSSSAVASAWNRIRVRADLKTLQFRHLRHIGATHYARLLRSAHALREILGHKTLFMAQVYVNFVKDDLLEMMDAAESTRPMLGALPPVATGGAQEIMSRKKVERLNGAATVGQKEADVPVAPEDAASGPLPINVIPFRPNPNTAWPCPQVAAKRIFHKT